MGYLSLYTGEVREPHIPRALADSVHMTYTDRDGKEHTLNQGYGILYAQASIRPDNTIAPRGIRNPRGLALPKGDFGILAEPVDEAGEPLPEAGLLLWRTGDFLRFRQESVEDANGTGSGGQCPGQSLKRWRFPWPWAGRTR